jgi:hypothetical protein
MAWDQMRHSHGSADSLVRLTTSLALLAVNLSENCICSGSKSRKSRLAANRGDPRDVAVSRVTTDIALC